MTAEEEQAVRFLRASKQLREAEAELQDKRRNVEHLRRALADAGTLAPRLVLHPSMGLMVEHETVSAWPTQPEFIAAMKAVASLQRRVEQLRQTCNDLSA